MRVEYCILHRSELQVDTSSKKPWLLRNTYTLQRSVFYYLYLSSLLFLPCRLFLRQGIWVESPNKTIIPLPSSLQKGIPCASTEHFLCSSVRPGYFSASEINQPQSVNHKGTPLWLTVFHFLAFVMNSLSALFCSENDFLEKECIFQEQS